MLWYWPMPTTVSTRFFRAGVGTVIYNQAGEVALFERATNPIGVWQFQQGGIDLGEDIETTLWRELKEENGLEKRDFTSTTLYPKWTVYQDTNTVDDATKPRLGQAHRWYFLELAPDSVINLKNATEVEASDYRFVSFTEAITAADTYKKHVYEELETYFLGEILKEKLQ